jgi:hypothetical protein
MKDFEKEYSKYATCKDCVHYHDEDGCDIKMGDGSEDDNCDRLVLASEELSEKLNILGSMVDNLRFVAKASGIDMDLFQQIVSDLI